jgi:hypothetical protein
MIPVRPNSVTMSNQDTSHAIRTRIDAFLSELSGFVRRAALESVEEVLGDGTAPTRRRGPGRPKGSGRRRPGRPRKAGRRARRAVARAGKRTRRSAADLEKIADRVLAHVRSNPGQRLEQIGKALEVETAVLKRPVANLLARKKLRTKGQRRGTMYFAGGGRGGARKSKTRRPAKRTRKAKTRGRRQVKRGRNAAKKSAARRTPPRMARRGPARRKRVQRKRSRKAPASKASAVADALALQAAMPTAPV